MYDLGITGGEVFLRGELVKINLYINNDHIVAYNDKVMPCKDRYDVPGCHVYPGIIDPHVHFDCGSPTPTADDFYSGSMTAAHGGVTTIIDFLPSVNKGAELENALRQRKKLAVKSMIDFKFHAVVENPIGEVDTIVTEMKRLGINSVTVATADVDGIRKTRYPEMVKLLERSKEGLVIIAHTEEEGQEALSLGAMVSETGGKLYMLCVASGQTLDALYEAYRDIMGKRFIVESCPRYFWLTEACMKGEDADLYTCLPPLKSEAVKERLKARIKHIHTIGTDHRAFMKADKEGKDLENIPMGVGGIEDAFSLMYTLYGPYAIKKMAVNPAKVFGLYPRKGALALGSLADIMVYDPRQKRVITKDHSASDYTIYKDLEVQGKVIATLSKGQFVVKEEALVLGSVGHWLKATFQ